MTSNEDAHLPETEEHVRLCPDELWGGVLGVARAGRVGSRERDALTHTQSHIQEPLSGWGPEGPSGHRPSHGGKSRDPSLRGRRTSEPPGGRIHNSPGPEFYLWNQETHGVAGPACHFHTLHHLYSETSWGHCRILELNLSNFVWVRLFGLLVCQPTCVSPRKCPGGTAISCLPPQLHLSGLSGLPHLVSLPPKEERLQVFLL